MSLRADQITIAITVFHRRDYVHAAIRSALEQTVPVKVIIVENCSPDKGFRDYVLNEFGDRVEYFQNSRNRGMFDNWNACMEYCRTPWLSILHDDDLLRPNFVEAMLRLAEAAPNRSLYFGRQARLENGRILPLEPVDWQGEWGELDPRRLADECFVLFPGQLFRIADAQAIGGFRKISYFTGDWDMWFRLAVKFGGAQCAPEVALIRGHEGADRGTTVVVRKGWKYALDNCQRKRNLLFLEKEKGVRMKLDRAKLLREKPMPMIPLLRFAPEFSRRILRYNAWLFVRCRPPHWRYAVVQGLVKIFGPGMLRRLAVLAKRAG